MWYCTRPSHFALAKGVGHKERGTDPVRAGREGGVV